MTRAELQDALVQYGFFNSVLAITANTTLNFEHQGKLLLCTTADLVLTLPSAGGKFVFFIKNGALSSSTGLSISPASTDTIDGGTANKDLINTGATDVIGDSVIIKGDGGTNWYTIMKGGIWAKEA